MENPLITVAALAVSIVILIDLLRRGGTRNPLFAVAAFFVLFAFGPAINYLLGQGFYFGIVTEYIPQASMGFALALSGIWAADRLWPQRTDYDIQTVQEAARYRYDFLPFGFLATSGYAFIFVAPNIPQLLNASKQQAIALAGSGHYTFMSIATCMTAFYFVSRRTRFLRQMYMVHCISFVIYSLAFRERDFFLIFIAILVHREILNGSRRSWKVMLSAVATVIGASWMFSSRTGEGGVDIEGILNQGSILFVDTFIMSSIPGDMQFQYGSTYVDALLRLGPGFLDPDRGPTLAERLVQMYNPGGSSGYGFSLSAEAYLNFGMAGIPIVFFVIACTSRLLLNRLDRGDWYLYVSVFFMQAWMYALRGDSLQLMKTTLLAAGIFILFRVLSGRADRPISPQSAAERPTSVDSNVASNQF